MKANSSDKRNGERHDDGGAEADQEEDQHDQHQHHAAKQVGFHGVGGELHQFAAIVERMNLYVGRQDLPVQFFGLCLDSFQDGLRLLAAAHEDHALDRVIIFLETRIRPRRGAWPMVTSPTSRTRIGTPLLLPTTMFPMSSVLRTRPMPRT